MDINLDSLIDGLDPDPVTITIGSGKFAVHDLTIGQMLKLSDLAAVTTKDGATEADSVSLTEYLAACFKGKAPPPLAAYKASVALGEDEKFEKRQKLKNQVSLIAAAVTIAFAEVASSKKVDRAADQIINDLSKAREASASSPG